MGQSGAEEVQKHLGRGIPEPDGATAGIPSLAFARCRAYNLGTILTVT